jgi:pimeloyl-ACP methyl ester carboxylesterase
VDFDTELDGYRQGLRALLQLDFVNADEVFLFGHSQGGVIAPLIAVEMPVRGLAVYGTASETWFECMFGQRRRLASLDGTNPADVNPDMLDQARLFYPLFVQRKTPREIREADPEIPKRVWDQWIKDDNYVAERTYKFHHQFAERNMAEVWTKVAATRLSFAGKERSEPLHARVLAIWGKTDWLSTKSQHTWIADVVNRIKPGSATFVELDSVDHFFFRTKTAEESYRYIKPVKGMPPTEFNRAIIDTLQAWLDETTGRTKKG